MPDSPRSMDVSRSGWRSMIIKCVRLGWPAGLRHAARHTTTSDLKYLLKRQVWEDIFPHPDELEDVYAEVDALDIDALCARGTHHQQLALTDDFCDLSDEAMSVKKGKPAKLWDAVSECPVFVPMSVANCFWTWHVLRDEILPGRTRSVDDTPYSGVPPAMLDSHTSEGRKLGNDVTVLSGHYSQHREISRIVCADDGDDTNAGWQTLRDQVHAEPVIVSPDDTDLFS